MRTSIFHRCLILGAVVFVSIFTETTARAQSQPYAPAVSRPKRLRLGVYDSRAIAVAYVNSREFQIFMKPAQNAYDKAKLENNQKVMQELQHGMELAQHRLNEEAYSTASVAAIMATIKNSVPAVAKEAGVDAIVSKWELNYQAPEVETEDVTDKLIALFHTTEQGWQWAREIQKKPPLPIEKVNAPAN